MLKIYVKIVRFIQTHFIEWPVTKTVGMSKGFYFDRYKMEMRCSCEWNKTSFENKSTQK